MWRRESVVPPPADIRNVAATPVSELMSTLVVTARMTRPVDEALDVLRHSGGRHLVVVGPKGRCRGLVSVEQLIDPLRIAGLKPVPVGDLISGSSPSLTAHATAADAAALMVAGGIDALCVVDRRDRPIGVVTWSDLLALAARLEAGSRGSGHLLTAGSPQAPPQPST